MAMGIVVGWLAGMWLSLSPLTLSIIFAFISGAMILNVLQKELPHENNAHFPTFTLAAISYTVVTMSLILFRMVEVANDHYFLPCFSLLAKIAINGKNHHND
ncbi:hypothetical protein [Salicibibacter kimchii]|uniref:hypothetical protein n=1 Tax=Salicibibacter kimchii TaxID=2099786 RepID=UPI001D04C264|nr:hypothetical protein [Salicibibacter kimchii]